jgi:aromatic ring-opening dioxygenase catalytic subunit (LigB family)
MSTPAPTAVGTRLPTYFISHGGGPWPWIEDLMPGDFTPLRTSLQRIPRDVGVTPKAILAVSGHWETPAFTVQTSPNPPMLYDYGGFPDFTYRIQYPAPGSPEVAVRAKELLEGAGFPVREDAERGFDHGVFAPFAVSHPDADVPILQLSIKQSYDPAEHLAAGRALAPLRDEGVLIVGSGFTFHNLRLFGTAGVEPSRQFDGWLTDAVVDGPVAERTARLLRWDEAPAARLAHPAEDHLVPLFVAIGAAEDEPGVLHYHEDAFMNSISSSSYRFGALPERPAA